ncbi:Hypothetical predicted protein [Olea europaea subsp. europaea]|uniref:Uncharacterized protein n=1 Tax=Olea europaea subsp. europaea TaxID=158383 RepID=A0A8S0T859_OLEEU|nr:Hypothetical predicted protein [Olea europaea subsp. europaea]
MVIVGSGCFDVLERDFYLAIHAAYYGPEIESMELLPDLFEAEERSIDSIPKVLYLVSGRRVAVATRIPSICSGGKQDEDPEDQIHVYLAAYEDSNRAIGSRISLGTITGLGTSPEEGSCYIYNNSGMKTHVIMKHRTLLLYRLFPAESSQNPKLDSTWDVGVRFGEISILILIDFLNFRNQGLFPIQRGGASSNEQWLSHSNSGLNTCTGKNLEIKLQFVNAYVVEPVCPEAGSINIIRSGWYVETFGRDEEGRTVPSHRRVHPAMYLLALAYRTLDIENARRRKLTVKGIVVAKMFGVLNWCERLV